MGIKKLMKEKGITQQRMAEHLGVHQTRVSQICCGVGEISLRQAELMAELLGCSVDDISKAKKENGCAPCELEEQEKETPEDYTEIEGEAG